ncbi:hypothetical protein [Mesorhizobium kowhaii]|uniref:Uncharacterized protein n=1 Tax=Mesorhizobium kowhaii TaxID=1300272 RepID=A0A2W7D306_9HYPH|nr:hypothetical protein [Mesorhizobium kowhaii]PZV40509.1 hypothetical protein B5V02_00310 [Mesorhizobium kowhaii]
MTMPLPNPDWTADEIVAHLKTIGTTASRAGMARFGINIAEVAGASFPDIPDTVQERTSLYKTPAEKFAECVAAIG